MDEESEQDEGFDSSFYSLCREWKWPLIALGLFLFGGALVGAYRKDSDERELEISREKALSGTLLRNHVTYLSKTFAPRSWDRAENQKRVADYIESAFRMSRAEVSKQSFEAEGRTFVNVIARFPGKTAGKIIIGAHYDSCGDTPGADDNASGVAGLLGLARMLRHYEPRHTIELVAYANEEPPWFGSKDMGSWRHAKSLKDAGDKVIAMICLEMIGYFSDAPGSQEYPLDVMKILYPSRGNFLAVVSGLDSAGLAREVKEAMKKKTDYPIVQFSMPMRKDSGVDLSDHRNYAALGMPAVMVTDTAFMRNKEYHTPRDTADKLDYGKMEQAVKGLFEVVRSLDDRNAVLFRSR